MRESSSGQVLAFYSEPSTTWHCFSCNAELSMRCKLSHNATRTHRRNVSRRARPVHRARRESIRPSAYAFNSTESNDAALEAYYADCAVSDGTYSTIIAEFGKDLA